MSEQPKKEGGQGILGGLTDTVGSGLSGVTSTLGNTVGALGDGVGKTVSGVSTGAGNTVKATGDTAKGGLDTIGGKKQDKDNPLGL